MILHFGRYLPIVPFPRRSYQLILSHPAPPPLCALIRTLDPPSGSGTCGPPTWTPSPCTPPSAPSFGSSRGPTPPCGLDQAPRIHRRWRQFHQFCSQAINIIFFLNHRNIFTTSGCAYTLRHFHIKVGLMKKNAKIFFVHTRKSIRCNTA